MSGTMLIKNFMKIEIKSRELLKLLRDREKVVQDGFPLFDKIEKIVGEVIKKNLKNIASDNEVWKYLKPYINEEDYKKANKKLGEVYKDIQKLEYKMLRLKDKVTPLVEKENIELNEFEIIGKVFAEKDTVYVEKIDQIEEYKKMLREKK